MRYAWFGISEPVIFVGFFWTDRYCYSTFFTVREFYEASAQGGGVSG